MTDLRARLGRAVDALSRPMLCDASTEDGLRFGDAASELDDGGVLGRWPDELETDAVIRLAQAVGEDAPWDVLADMPPVAQKLAERARPQPLDIEIFRHLQHLQHVCHRPRLHLRVEEERLPVSRARRTPVRAVADLVSHPGDWEHRTLRSIQPSRVLARLIEDEWNLYENRVAVGLVDHLLAYLARRLEELRAIEETLRASRDHSDEARTSFWRARRIMTLWADTITSKTEDELLATMRRLELVQRDLQALLDAPLYQRLPRRISISLSLKPTNILVNDPHYRKIAALWRAWVKFGHKRQETHEQRVARRQREARAWDRFVLHLVARAFTGLECAVQTTGSGWNLVRAGRTTVQVEVDADGVVTVHSKVSKLRLLPLCADLSRADAALLLEQLSSWDRLDGEIVVVHVGSLVDLADPDRAAGWSFAGRTVLFGCSPWGIDSEERMARLLNGWLHRAAVRPYPAHEKLRHLPDLPREWAWLRYDGAHLVGLRAPEAAEVHVARAWAARTATELEAQAQRAKLAKQVVAVAPQQAVGAFQRFVDTAVEVLAGLDECPVCGDKGRVVPRGGQRADSSDATWWATCTACRSEWGLRPCTGCGARFHALVPQVGPDVQQAASAASPSDWPDKALGRDVWAQPCRWAATQFRCPKCGACARGGCERCQK